MGSKKAMSEFRMGSRGQCSSPDWCALNLHMGLINSIKADSSKSVKKIIKYTTGAGELEETSWFLCMLQCPK